MWLQVLPLNGNARMAGIIIADSERTDFSANFTLGVNFDDRAIRTAAGSLPEFVDAGIEYSFTLTGLLRGMQLPGFSRGALP